MITKDDEPRNVADWNTEQLEGLGIKHDLALIIVRSGIDWHDIRKLIRQGATVEQALRILEPL